MQLRQKLYETYANHTGWKSLATGADLPQWLDIKPEIQEAWGAVADFVIEGGDYQTGYDLGYEEAYIESGGNTFFETED